MIFHNTTTPEFLIPNKMYHALEKKISALLTDAGVAGAVDFSSPPKPEMGDVAFGCFALAKKSGQKPNEVASEIVKDIEKLRNLEIIERVQAFGPYVNFFLKPGVVAGMVLEDIFKKAETFGFSSYGEGKSVMIEYPSNNTHKEFHVGHLRNVCIGNPLVNLYKAAGYTVHSVNYLNDFGAHVARCLWGLLTLHKDENPPENKQKWLGDIYAQASMYLKEHPECQAEVSVIQQKLEAHDPELWNLFVETRQWSIDQFERLFKELGIAHEAVFCEKDVKAQGHDIVSELLEKDIAQIGERGAIIIDLNDYNLDVALLRKADGTGLYMTSDIPLAYKKFEKFDVDESIIITGLEQNFYFKQLFKVLELVGFKKKMTHIGYALLTRPEGKMSSRLGNVILYEDLRDEIYQKLYTETQERHAQWTSEQLADTSTKLTLAAMKFDIQKHEANKNIVFDIKEATSFEGFSGPYILYSVARINSIIRKAEVEAMSGAVDYSLLTQTEETRLALMMGEYESVLKKALEQYNPSVIARYCFDLAQAFNDFYAKHSILNAAGTELLRARLALAQAVALVLKNALGILSIETVETM